MATHDAALPDVADKAAWRTWAHDARRGVDVAAVSAAIVGHLSAWEPLRSGPRVALFLPMPGEIDLRPLLDALPDIEWVTTRTPERGGLTVHRLPAPLERHRYGFEQPAATVPVVDPAEVSLWLVPGVAFDRRGGRLGHGRGYYDALLRQAAVEAWRVGVAPEALVVGALPVTAHDVPMTHVVTERGVREVDRG